MIGCFYCDKEKKYKSHKKEKTNTFIGLYQSTRNIGKKRSQWRIGCSSFRFTALSNKNIDKHDEDSMLKDTTTLRPLLFVPITYCLFTSCSLTIYPNFISSPYIVTNIHRYISLHFSFLLYVTSSLVMTLMM